MLPGMWGAIKEFLTADGTQWFETLPFVVGFAFVTIEIIVRLARRRRPYVSVPALGYMLSEGITVCIIPMYGLALAFNKSLATAIAEKNSKVLAVAMFVAFATLAIHILKRWFSNDETDA